MNDVRVFRGGIINRAGRRRRQTRLISRSRLHSGQVIPRFFGPVKTIVQRESRHWMHTMNGRSIATFSSGVTHNISQRVLI